MSRPKNSESTEMDKLTKQFDQFDTQVKSLTMDRLNETPKKEVEQQTKIAQKDLEKTKETYLQPIRQIPCKEKFDEKYREKYNFSKEYVNFIAENKEIIGEAIEVWTRPYAGMPAQEWKIPVNTPVWAPRYVAEQLKRKFYHRLTMKENIREDSGHTQFYGTMVADTTVQRLDAHPVSQRRSVFMGAA